MNRFHFWFICTNNFFLIQSIFFFYIFLNFGAGRGWIKRGWDFKTNSQNPWYPRCYVSGFSSVSDLLQLYKTVKNCDNKDRAQGRWELWPFSTLITSELRSEWRHPSGLSISLSVCLFLQEMATMDRILPSVDHQPSFLGSTIFKYCLHDSTT